MIYTIADAKEKDLLGGKIDRDGVLTLVAHFRDNIYSQLAENQKTHCAFFTKAEIEELFRSLPQADGVRVYFAAVHPDFENGRPGTQERLTAVMVGTQKNDTNTLDVELLNNEQKIIVGIPNPALDFATLCPPDCNRIQRHASGGASIQDDVYVLNLP